MFCSKAQTVNRMITRQSVDSAVSCLSRAFGIFILCTLLLLTLSAGKAVASPKQIKEKLPKLLGLVKDAADKALVTQEGKIFEVHVPHLPLQVYAFHTQRGGWNVALDLTNPTKDLSSALVPIVSVYPHLADYLGDLKNFPVPQAALFVVNEKGCGITDKELPKKLKHSFKDLVDTQEAKAMGSPHVSFYSGLNIPKKGPLAELADILAAGGTFHEDIIKIKGEFAVDMIKQLLKYFPVKASSPSKTPSTDGVRLAIELPSVTPFPFNTVERISKNPGRRFNVITKRPFFDIDFGKTILDITLGGGIKASANRSVTFWLEGKKLGTADNAIQIGLNKDRQAKKSVFDVKSTCRLDFPKGKDLMGSLTKGELSLTYLEITGELKNARINQTKKLNIGFDLGAGIKIMKKHTVDVDIDVEVTKEKDKVWLSNLALTLDEKGSALPFDLADASFLKNIPLIHKLDITEKVTIGLMVPPKEEDEEETKPEFYINGQFDFSDLGIAGDLGILSRDKDFLLLAELKHASGKDDFSLIDLLPKNFVKSKPEVAKVVKTLKIPEAKGILTLTNIKPTGHSIQLKDTDLPPPLRKVFGDMISQTNGRLPIHGDGINILIGFNLESMAKPLKDLGLKGMAPKGELLLGGSLSGIFGDGDDLKVGLYAQMANFTLPSDQPFTKIIDFKNATAGFYLSLDMDDQDFQAGLYGDFDIALPRIDKQGKKDQLDVGGEIYVDLSDVGVGVRVGCYKDGDWHDPLGIGNVTISDTAFLFGMNEDASVDLAFGGGVIIKTKQVTVKSKEKNYPTKHPGRKHLRSIKAFQKKMAHIKKGGNHPSHQQVRKDLHFGIAFSTLINFDASGIPVPEELGFMVKADKLGALPMAEVADTVVRGIIAGPMAHQMVHIANLPAKDQKAIDHVLDRIKNGPSLIKVLRLDQFPLPFLEADDVLLYFATPGVTLPGLPDFNKGIGAVMKGTLYIDFKSNKKEVAGADLRLTLTDGLKVAGNIGNFSLLGETIALSKAKADIQIGIPGVNGTNVPRFILTGHIKALFAKGDIDVEFDATKIHFSMKDKLGAFGTASLTFDTLGKSLAQAKDFTFSSDLKFDLEKGLKKDIEAPLLAYVTAPEKAAKKARDGDMNEVKGWNKKIQKERQKIMAKEVAEVATIDAERKKGLENLEKREENLSRAHDKAPWYEKPFYDVAIVAVQASIAVFNETLEIAENGILAMPVDLDPALVKLNLERDAAWLRLHVSDLEYRALKDIADTFKKDMDALIKRLKDAELTEGELKVSSNSMVSEKITLYLNFKKANIRKTKIINLSNAHTFKKKAEKLAEGMIDFAAETMISVISQNLHRDFRKKVSSKNPSSAIEALKLAKAHINVASINTDKARTLCDFTNYPKPNLNYFSNSYFYLSLQHNHGKQHLVQTGCNSISASGQRKSLYNFVKTDNGNKVGTLSSGDHVAIISPLGRYLSLNNRKGQKEIIVADNNRKYWKAFTCAFEIDDAEKFQIVRVKKAQNGHATIIDGEIRAGDVVMIKQGREIFGLVGYKGEILFIARKGSIKYRNCLRVTDMVDKQGHHTTIYKKAHARTAKQAIADPHPGFTKPRRDKGSYGKLPTKLCLDKGGKLCVD